MIVKRTLIAVSLIALSVSALAESFDADLDLSHADESQITRVARADAEEFWPRIKGPGMEASQIYQYADGRAMKHNLNSREQILDYSDAFVKTIQQLDIDSKTAPVVNKSTETSNDDKEDHNLQDWEDDLNLAWKALSDKQRDQLRAEQRSWIKYKDSLPLAKKIEAIKKRCHYLWPFSGN